MKQYAMGRGWTVDETIGDGLSDAQLALLDVVTSLSSLEEKLRNREKSIELTDWDIAQLAGGFTVSVLHEGRTVRLRMRGE